MNVLFALLSGIFFLAVPCAFASGFVFLEEPGKAASYSDIITAARGQEAIAEYHSDTAWKDLAVSATGSVLALTDSHPTVLYEFSSLDSWQDATNAVSINATIEDWKAIALSPTDTTIWVLSSDGLTAQQFASISDVATQQTLSPLTRLTRYGTLSSSTRTGTSMPS